MNRKIILTAVIMITASLMLSGCDGSSDIIKPPETYMYSISGVVVKDLNTDVISDSTRIAVKLRLENNPANNAEMTFFNQTLTYGMIDNSANLAYVFPAGNQSLINAGNYQLNIADSTLLDDNIQIVVLDTIRINSYNPDSTTVNLNGEVNNIQWTSALNIEGETSSIHITF